jgi:hypothetical protein
MGRTLSTHRYTRFKHATWFDEHELNFVFRVRFVFNAFRYNEYFPAPMFTQPSRKSILKLPPDVHKIQAYCRDSDALGQGVISPHIKLLLSGTMSGVSQGT